MSTHASFEQIRSNLLRVHEQIDEATDQAHRPADAVQLVAVSKYVDVEAAAALVEAGCRDLGESRPQQLWAKGADPRLASVQWHLIGHLQRNKVAKTVALGPLIHGIDSLRTLEAVDQAAQRSGNTIRLLLEVNCSGDPEKHGFEPAVLASTIAAVAPLKQVRITGLMTMAARGGDLAVARKNFAQLRTLRDTASRSAPPNAPLTELSMGMSGDFREAILEGATLIRIGSALWQGVDRPTA